MWTRSPEYLLQCRDRYGDTFTIDNVGYFGPWVMVSDPTSVQVLFSASPDRFRASSGTEVLEALMGASSVVLLRDGAHRRIRRVLLPPMHRDRIEPVRAAVADLAHREIDGWRAGEVMALRPRMQAITVAVILRVVFGVAGDHDRYRAFDSAMHRFIDGAFAMGPLMAMAMMRWPNGRDARWMPWAAFRRSARDLDTLLFSEMRSRRRVGDLDGDDVLSMLLLATDDEGCPLSDDEVRDQILTFLLAGYETSATSLAWTFDLLVHSPLVWGRLARDERPDAGYAAAVVKESLRLRPPLLFVSRTLAGPWSIAGYDLDAGVTVVACTALVHRHPATYGPDPDAFRPDRFLEQAADRHTWIPFGGGDRRCVGAPLALMEMEEVVKAVASRVSIEPTAPTVERAKRRYIVFGPARGARVRIVAVDN